VAAGRAVLLVAAAVEVDQAPEVVVRVEEAVDEQAVAVPRAGRAVAVGQSAVDADERIREMTRRG